MCSLVPSFRKVFMRTPMFVGFGFGCTLGRLSAFVIVMFAFLCASVFSAINALVNITRGKGLLGRGNRLPGTGNTLLTSTIKAYMNTSLNMSAIADCIRSDTNISTNNEANLTSIAATNLFLTSLILSPLFLTVPTFTAAPTVLFIKLLVLDSVGGVGFRNSVTSIVNNFLTIIVVPLACSVSGNVVFNVLS